MKLKLLFSIFIFVISLNAIELTKPLIMDISRTYGYVTSQSLVAEKLKKKYPEVSQELTIAQLEFDLKYKSSMENIKKAFGKEWQKYQEIMEPQLIEQANKFNLDLSYKNGFANEILARAKGNIESPVIETLLMFNPKYQKYPISEFTDGFKKRLYSKNTAKSKDIDFHIDVPQSWKVKDAKRPNTLWMAINNNGYFDEYDSQVSFGVVIQELPERIDSITQTEANKFCNEFLKDTPIKECTKITLENLPAIYARNTTELQRLKVTATMEVANYIVFYNDKMIILQGMVNAIGNKLTQQELNEKFDKYLPLFDQIANSLVIKDLYTKEQNTQTQYYLYKLFDNRLQAVFPDTPTIQEIPSEQIDPKALEKMIPYKYKKDMSQNQVEKLVADMIIQMKNSQPYIYVDNINQIWYSSQTMPSQMKHENYIYSGIKNTLDNIIKDSLKADGRTLMNFSSTLDANNNTYIAVYDSNYFIEDKKVYTSTKHIYHKDSVFKWSVSYVNKEDKSIFDEYQDNVKIIR